ncbi:hypothetical protein BRADI_2g10056v3 [Brachypodium distachyon]|uniref:VWFA domain-containing protein n=1 Tax=Brachypodium distachyon TaxID=15368 RepID=A0A0Q3ITS6_BRADI|nr:hypothetical protein BRADI_2g10056v3 [Brachypodium distachyon]
MSYKMVRAAAPPAAAVYTDDDGPLENRTALAQAPAATNNGGGLVLKTQCEFPALGRSAWRDKFARQATWRAHRSTFVTVLDVSGSMEGPKLALLKQAMGFVIDQLGPSDRLSVVTFSSAARRLTGLALMSNAGKAAAKAAVESLVAGGGTRIGEGLRVAAHVLGGRRRKNAVPSVILLSDGRDATLIHTFGFGGDHDAAAMHAVAEATGGTFSFVENQAAIQDSFAQCVGGLLSVAVREARIAVRCLHRGVRLQEIKSGGYRSEVHDDGRAGSIDLYEDEERRFLALVYVPRARDAEHVTRLLKVSCTYRDAGANGSQAAHVVSAPAAAIERPFELADMPPPCMDVERERVRLAATRDIAATRAAADGGQHAGAAKILDSRLVAVERSAPGLAADPACEALKEELRDLSARVGDRHEYRQTGRACLLAGMSSHSQQRASAVELKSSTSSNRARAYLTPKMKRTNGEQPDGTSKQIKQDLTENF